MRHFTLLLFACFGMACAGSPARQPVEREADAVEDKNIYIHRPISDSERAAERSSARAREQERHARAAFNARRVGPPWKGLVTHVYKPWDRQYITISFGRDTLLRNGHHVNFSRRGKLIGSARVMETSSGVNGESKCVTSPSTLDVMVGDDVVWDDDTLYWDE